MKAFANWTVTVAGIFEQLSAVADFDPDLRHVPAFGPQVGGQVGQQLPQLGCDRVVGDQKAPHGVFHRPRLDAGAQGRGQKRADALKSCAGIGDKFGQTR